MPLISCATRFFANGHAGLRPACALSARTRASPATSTSTPAISARAANDASLSRSVPPPGTLSGASSGVTDESARITVARPDAAARERVVTARSVTSAQVVAPRTTVTVNGVAVSNAPLCPVTRT